MVTLQLNLPNWTYRAVAKIATDKGINAHTLIEQMLLKALSKSDDVVVFTGDVPDELINEIAILNRRRWLTDEQIATRLRLPVEKVTAHRVAMKLPVRELDFTKQSKRRRA